MKNLTKIFTAVVAGMFAFSCVNDTTDDLGIEVGKSGVTEITVSLEESRTQLGEKVDGKYPLYWSEGDAIAVNGVVSAPLTAEVSGQVAASFTFPSVLTHPFNVVYPAPAEGATAAEGLYPVTFLATQPYTEGTFAPGVAPMYGYAANADETVQLNHLSGVLRFAIKGEKALSSIVIAAEGKIAGIFDVNCQTGELTAHADASNTVTVTFGEGLALGAEATPIYVAVPAGEHGLYTITINSTEGEEMVVRYDSAKNPVKAGIVKEFGEILYAPSAVADPEGELVIVSESDMLRLQKWAADGKLANVTKVTVGATIDMSGVTTWQPIVGFPAIEFDGGSDKGYEIKGLTSALFGTVTGATIKNVKLTEVNINEDAKAFFGSLVCHAVSSTISNCEASGVLVYDNQVTSGHTASTFGVGGLIGKLEASSLSGSTNAVNVTIKNFAPVKAASSTYVGVGGLVGSSYGVTIDSADVYSTISNSYNYGNLTSSQGNGSWQPCLGGIAGYAYKTNASNVVNGKAEDKNIGNILITAGGCTGSGGIMGNLTAVNVDTATNYGSVEISIAMGYPYIGGCFGTLINSTGSIKNVDNYGALKVPNTSFGNGTPYFGGVIGRIANTKWTIDDCDNYAPFTIQATFASIKSGNMSCIGAIVGGTEGGTFKNCDNYANMTVEGTWGKLTDAETYGPSVFVGGVVGRISDASAVIENCHNGDVNATTPNTLAVNIKTGGLLFTGGVAGHFAGKTLKNCGNHGNISISGESGSFQDSKAPNKTSVFGGVIGYGANADMVISGCTNAHNGDTDDNHITMTINFKANAIASSTDLGSAIFGGVFGLMNSAKSATDCSNNCAINATINYNSTTGSLTTLGAFAGKLGVKAVRCSNGALGDLTVAGTAAANVGVAGLNCSTTTTEDCSNAGDINVSVNNSTNGAIYINGLAWTGTTSANHTNFVNSGNITYTGKAKANAFISGMVYTPSGVLKNCQNKGTITANVNDLACPLKIGGFVRSSSTATYDGCVNSGDIVFKGTSTSAVYIGGLCGDVNGACKFTGAGFVNKGSIKFLGTTTSTGYAGGIAGAATVSMGETAVLKNEGTVTNYDATAALTGSAATVRWGGCFGSISSKPQSVEMVNTGDIYVRYSEKMGADVTVGGIAGGSSQLISNAKVDCSIAAIGFVESAASPIVGVGMVIGTHRGTSAMVSKCKIGGKYALTEKNGEPDWLVITPKVYGTTDASDEFVPADGFTPFWTKIYGGTWAAASENNCEECSYESANVPVEPTAL